MSKSLRGAAVVLAVIGLSACASVSVDGAPKASGEPRAPGKIYVQDFTVPAKVLRVDRGGEALETFRKSLQEQLTRAIVERSRQRLRPSFAVRRQTVPPHPSAAWLVSGRFVTVNQGSRALRTILGLGAGGTKVETEVTVSDLSGAAPRAFLKFKTTGGSNAMPGAAFGLVAPNYWLIALDVTGKIGAGLNIDVIRTSREIVAVLSEYMAQEGFLSPAKISRAKKLGQWP